MSIDLSSVMVDVGPIVQDFKRRIDDLRQEVREIEERGGSVQSANDLISKTLSAETADGCVMRGPKE